MAISHLIRRRTPTDEDQARVRASVCVRVYAHWTHSYLTAVRTYTLTHTRTALPTSMCPERDSAAPYCSTAVHNGNTPSGSRHTLSGAPHCIFAIVTVRGVCVCVCVGGWGVNVYLYVSACLSGSELDFPSAAWGLQCSDSRSRVRCSRQVHTDSFTLG